MTYRYGPGPLLYPSENLNTCVIGTLKTNDIYVDDIGSIIYNFIENREFIKGTTIIWSEYLEIFIVLNNSSVYLSNDGIIWSTASISNNDWTSVCWSNELSIFCAVSSNSNISSISSNGVNWSTNSLTMSSDWSSICWSSELESFYTVSNSDQIINKSLNGILWTSIYSPHLSNCIIWSDEFNKLISIGNGIYYSGSDLTWTLSNELIWNYGCIAQNKVIVAGNNKYGISTNLIGWNIIENSFDINYISFAEQISTFLSCSDQVFQYSYDGLLWTTLSTNNGASCISYSRELNIFYCVSPEINVGSVAIVNNLFQINSYAYIISNTTNLLSICDITNEPIVVSTLSLTSQISLYVYDNFLYSLRSNGFMTIVDVSSALIPSIVSSVSITGPQSVIAIDDYIYLNTLTSFNIYDSTIKTFPILISSIGHYSTISSMSIVNDIVYILGSNSILSIDISNPILPVLIDTFEIVNGVNGSHMLTSDSINLYMINVINNSFDIISIDPMNLISSTTHSSIVGPSSISVDSSYIYISSATNLVSIFQGTIFICTLGPTNSSLNIQVLDDYIYVSDANTFYKLSNFTSTKIYKDNNSTLDSVSAYVITDGIAVLNEESFSNLKNPVNDDDVATKIYVDESSQFHPSGSNGSIQYNANGLFGASSNLTWSTSTNTLNVNGLINTDMCSITEDMYINNVHITAPISYTTYTLNLPIDTGSLNNVLAVSNTSQLYWTTGNGTSAADPTNSIQFNNNGFFDGSSSLTLTSTFNSTVINATEINVSTLSTFSFGTLNTLIKCSTSLPSSLNFTLPINVGVENSLLSNISGQLSFITSTAIPTGPIGAVQYKIPGTNKFSATEDLTYFENDSLDVNNSIYQDNIVIATTLSSLSFPRSFDVCSGTYGNYTYISATTYVFGNPDIIYSINISNPINIVTVDTVMPLIPSSLFVYNFNAYITDSTNSTLNILDIEPIISATTSTTFSLSSMSFSYMKSQLKNISGASYVQVKDAYAYVVGSNIFRIINVSDTYNPIVVSTLGLTGCSSLCISQFFDYVYVLSNTTDILTFINVSNKYVPVSNTITGTTLGYPINIQIGNASSNIYLYVSNLTSQNVQTLLLNNNISATLVKTYSSLTTIKQTILYEAGSVLYMLYSNNLAIASTISNTTQVVHTLNGNSVSMTLTYPYLFVQCAVSLYKYDLSVSLINPTSSFITNLYSPVANYISSTTYNGQYYILTSSDIYKPFTGYNLDASKVIIFNNNNNIKYILLNNQNLYSLSLNNSSSYLNNNYHTLSIIDVDKMYIRYQYQYYTGSSVMVLYKTFLLISYVNSINISGIYVVDLDNLNILNTIIFNTLLITTFMSVYNNYLYVVAGAGTSVLYIYDISDINNIIQLNSYNSLSSTSSGVQSEIIVNYPYIYPYNDINGLILNVSDPNNITTSLTTYSGYPIAISGNYLYTVVVPFINVYDIRVRSTPTLVSTLSVSAFSGFISGKNLFTLTSSSFKSAKIYGTELTTMSASTIKTTELEIDNSVISQGPIIAENIYVGNGYVSQGLIMNKQEITIDNYGTCTLDTNAGTIHINNASVLTQGSSISFTVLNNKINVNNIINSCITQYSNGFPYVNITNISTGSFIIKITNYSLDDSYGSLSIGFITI